MFGAVPKDDNPKCTENYWVLLPRAVYAKGWEANIEAELCSRIKRKLKAIDISVVDERRSNKAMQNSRQ
jgi:hypothetical protein